MALDAKHRSSIYGKLVPLLGEEDADVLMSEFPSIEGDELVTKDFLRAELAELTNRLTIRIVGLIVALVAAIEALTTLV